MIVRNIISTIGLRTGTTLPCRRFTTAVGFRQTRCGSNNWKTMTTTTTTTMARTSPTSTQASSLFQSQQYTRFFATMPEDELKKRLEHFQELFVEARYCIEDTNDAAETTYFDEEADAAREAVKEAVEVFQQIVADIDDVDQKNSVLRSNGLKVEQLKGELQMALNGGHH